MESAGGVKLISGTKRISIDNTLDERLRLLEDRVRHFASDLALCSEHSHFVQMLPEIRKDLFGANDNRKFYN